MDELLNYDYGDQNSRKALKTAMSMGGVTPKSGARLIDRSSLAARRREGTLLVGCT